MTLIRYNLCTRVNRGTEENPSWNDVLTKVSMPWSEANEEIAKKEAYNGKYVIEDDGLVDPDDIPTQLDIIEAQVTYTAMMTGTLLEG